MRKRKPSIYMIALSVTMLIIGVIMVYTIYEAKKSLSNDALLINEAGVVRGSIQRLTKLVLFDSSALPHDAIVLTDTLLERFIQRDLDYYALTDDGVAVVQKMQRQWQRLRHLLLQYTASPNAELRQQLVQQSELCWLTSLEMVSRAQQSSELKLQRLQQLLYTMLLMNCLGAIAVVLSLILYVRRKLEHESVRDHLTGVYNRRMFDRFLSAEIERSERYGTALSMLLIDIDFFKRINDQLGHNAGDQVLVDFTAFMSDSIRSTDRLFRVGGEEFVILTPGLSGEVAMQMANKLREEVKSQVFTTGRSLTVSIGVSQFVNGESSDKLYRIADEALYQAKASGRDACRLA